MSIVLENLERLKEAARLENISDEHLSVLNTPVQVSYAELAVGDRKLPAWRIIYNRALGPGKGGIRFHPEVSEDEVQSLAFWMSLKNSLADIPYGGAKGGVKFNPKDSSLAELEEISRAYARAFADKLGQDKDVPAPDVYTNGQIMAYILDEFEKIKGAHEPGMITGKPLELGGIALRGDATAQGGYLVTKEMIKKFLSGKTACKIAVQGYGNAGLFMAEKLAVDGHLIVAASDSKGGIYNENGLDIMALSAWKNSGKSVSEFAGGQAVSNAELLELPVDILVLAALENQITADNAEKIQAPCIVELANGPINLAADRILANKKTVVVPDILANSGGVIVSYFEWAQNRTGQILDEEYLRDLLDKKMKSGWQRVVAKFEEKNGEITLRQAAYIIAIKRILAAEKYRGRIK